MYIRVHVYPGRKKEKIVKIRDHQYELMLKEPAERNLANKRAREIIAETYKIPVAKVRLITGHRSGSKLFALEV